MLITFVPFQDGSLRTSYKMTDSNQKFVFPFAAFVKLYFEDQEHVGRTFLQNLNLPPNISCSKFHSSLSKCFVKLNVF